MARSSKLKQFMKICYKCNTNIKVSASVKEGIELHCLKCPTCGEEYFTSSALTKFDILSGRKKIWSFKSLASKKESL